MSRMAVHVQYAKLKADHKFIVGSCENSMYNFKKCTCNAHKSA